MIIRDIPVENDGREIVKSASQPIGTTTVFTMVGDDQGIGDGKSIFWDFSNNDDLIQNPPVGYKQKNIYIKFNESIYIKEGCLYFHNSLKGSYLSLKAVCPIGQYYLDRLGTPHLATENVVVACFIIKHFFAGSCPMGDELNTEACQITPLPSNYKILIEVTVPDSDIESFGYGELEIYRERTWLFPGEII